MEYVIVTDSRKKKEKLYMVDRRKQTKSFWSDRLDDVMKFPTQEAAQDVASALKFNNPKVWPLHTAQQHVSGNFGNRPDILSMLQAKLVQWNDPDWNEGTNGSGCAPWDFGD
jgi:hypothetical protein